MKKSIAVLLVLLLVLPAGCAQREQESKEPLLSGPAVQVDWSKLEEKEPLAPVGSRYYEGYTDHLIPQKDYGRLVPYAGLRLMDDWPAATGCMYGMMTLDGTAVTDPVYSQVSAPGWDDEAGVWHTHPLLLLCQGSPGAEEWEVNAHYALAAADGSWCTGMDYVGWVSGEEGLLLFTNEHVEYRSPDGTVLTQWTAADLGLEQATFDEIKRSASWGEGIVWYNGRVGLGWIGDGTVYPVLTLNTGKVELLSSEEWQVRFDGLWTNSWSVREEGGTTVVTVEGQTYPIPHPYGTGPYPCGAGLVGFDDGSVYRLDGTPVLELGKQWVISFQRDNVLGDGAGLLNAGHFEENGGTTCYYLTDGTPLPQWTATKHNQEWYHQVSMVGGLLEVLDHDWASYYRIKDMKCVFRTPLGYGGD